MNYKVNLAARMLFNKRGSLAGAILAVTIGILVIHVNFVIFQGLFDAIVRDISDYNNGDILITSEESFITKSDLFWSIGLIAFRRWMLQPPVCMYRYA